MARITKNRTGAKSVKYVGKGKSGVILNPTITPLYNDGTCIVKFRLSLNAFDVTYNDILNFKVEILYADETDTPINGQEMTLDKKSVIWTDGGFYEINKTFKIDYKTDEMSGLITGETEAPLNCKLIVKPDSYNLGYGVGTIVSDEFIGGYIYRPSCRLGTSLPQDNNIQTQIRAEQYFALGYLNSNVGRISMRVGYDSEKHYRNWKGRFKMSPYLEIKYTNPSNESKVAIVNKFYKRDYLGKGNYNEQEYTSFVDFITFEQTPISLSDVTCSTNCIIDDTKTRWSFRTDGALTDGLVVDWVNDTLADSDLTIELKPNIANLT